MINCQSIQCFLTPIIAVIAVYITYQQWKTAKLKVDMDRYDRRLKIYQETQGFIYAVMRDVAPETLQMVKFRVDTAEADFIFPKEIKKYLDEIYSHAKELMIANNKKSGEDIYNISCWFADQVEKDIVKEKFKPFLTIL